MSERESIRFFDLAHEGAQVRALAGVVDDLARVVSSDVRSIVIVAPDALMRTAATFAVNERAPLRLPVVVTPVVPSFVGPLDVVVALSERGEDPVLSEALLQADRAGAATIVVLPGRSRLLEDAPERAVIIPALPSVGGFSPARAIMAVDTVLDAREEDPRLIEERLYELAHRLDAEIELVAPDRDETVNPARVLRSTFKGARVIHTGAPVGEVAAAIMSARGLVSGWVSPEEVGCALEEADTHRQGSAGSQDIFYDPYIDPESAMLPLRVIVWATEESSLPHSVAVDAPVEATPVARFEVALRLLIRAQAACVLDA